MCGSEEHEEFTQRSRSTQRARRRQERCVKLDMGGGLFSIGRREGAQLGDGGGNDFKRERDLGFGGVAAQAEAQAGIGLFLREADGGQDV